MKVNLEELRKAVLAKAATERTQTAEIQRTTSMAEASAEKLPKTILTGNMEGTLQYPRQSPLQEMPKVQPDFSQNSAQNTAQSQVQVPQPKPKSLLERMRQKQAHQPQQQPREISSQNTSNSAQPAQPAQSYSERIIPQGMEENADVKKMFEYFTALHDSLTEPEILGQQLRELMKFMHAHPQLFAVMTDPDFDLCAEASEIVLTKARMQKGARRSARKARTEEVDDIAKALKDGGLDTSDDELSNFFGGK